MNKRVFISSFITFLLLLLFLPGETQSQESISCTINLDRSSVPSLYFDDVTVLVQVNDAQNISVQTDNLDSDFQKEGNQIVVSTNASSISLKMTPGSNQSDLCQASIAPLRDNKKWAWSHGFDDNVGLRPAIEEFRAKSWTATIFAIAKDFAQFRNENWIVDEPFFNNTLLPEGWSLGNHSWNHERFDTSEPTKDNYIADIVDAQVRLEQAIARSSNPDFQVMVFASPNFSGAYDQPFLEVSETTALKLQETGNDYILTVTGSSDYTSGELTAKALEGRRIIGRDIFVEIIPQQVIKNIDWMAQNHASSGNVFWYNSLSHGGHEASLKAIIDHVWQNYGPDGTNEAWVASSTEIYSYILVRDAIKIDSEPFSQPSSQIEAAPMVSEAYEPSITRMQFWARSYSEDEQKEQVQPLFLNVAGRGLQQLKD